MAKNVWSSKLNWIGVFIVILGLFQDPTFQGYLGHLIPEPIMSKLISASGLLVVLVRTFFTDQAVQFRSEK